MVVTDTVCYVLSLLMGCYSHNLLHLITSVRHNYYLFLPITLYQSATGHSCSVSHILVTVYSHSISLLHVVTIDWKLLLQLVTGLNVTAMSCFVLSFLITVSATACYILSLLVKYHHHSMWHLVTPDQMALSQRVTSCHSWLHSQPQLVTSCHSWLHSQPQLVTSCHSWLRSQPQLVTSCHSWSNGTVTVCYILSLLIKYDHHSLLRLVTFDQISPSQFVTSCHSWSKGTVTACYILLLLIKYHHHSLWHLVTLDQMALSQRVTSCHSWLHSQPQLVTSCHSWLHSQPQLVTSCHSWSNITNTAYFILSLLIKYRHHSVLHLVTLDYTHSHSLLHLVTLDQISPTQLVTSCHSWLQSQPPQLVNLVTLDQISPQQCVTSCHSWSNITITACYILSLLTTVAATACYILSLTNGSHSHSKLHLVSIDWKLHSSWQLIHLDQLPQLQLVTLSLLAQLPQQQQQDFWTEEEPLCLWLSAYRFIIWQKKKNTHTHTHLKLQIFQSVPCVC